MEAVTSDMRKFEPSSCDSKRASRPWLTKASILAAQDHPLRHHHPALATHGEVFRRKERETGDIADAPCFDARCCHSAVCLSGVFDVSDAVIMTPLNQGIIAHLSEKVDGDDGFGSWRSCRFKRSKVNTPMVGLNVNENRGGTNEETHVAVAM